MDLASLGLTIDGRGAIRTLRQFTGSAHNAGRATEKFERSTKNLTAALGGLGAVMGVRQLAEYADTWTLIHARVKLVTDSHEQAVAVQTRLYNIAQRTRNTLAATSVLYTRVALNADQLGRSHEELLKVVDAVNSAMLLSGATGVESAQAMRQLAQALGAGRLQGDEFRTVMEAMPMVARAIADEMGVALGELYKLSKEGKISVQVILDALLNAQEELSSAAQEMPWTIGQSFEYLRNATTKMVGVMNMGLGASLRVGDAIKWIADNLNQLISGVGGVAAAFISYRIAALGAMAATKLLTAAQTIGAFVSLALQVRKLADAMALFQMVSKGAIGVVIALGAGFIGWKAYQTLLAQINAETAKWQEGLSDLNAQLGDGIDIVDEEALSRLRKARHEMEDMLREAGQAVMLAGFDDRAAERLSLHFDAINKKIEARREYTGDILVQMERAIDQEKELLLLAEEISASHEARKAEIAEQARIAERLAENIQRAFGDVFYNILENGLNDFSDLFDGIKQMFFRMLADMVAAQLMKDLGSTLKDILGLGKDAADMTTEQIDILIQGKINKAIEQAERIEALKGPLTPEEMERATAGETAIELDEIVVTAKAKENLAKVFAQILGSAMAGLGIGKFIGQNVGGGLGQLGGMAGGAAAGFAIGGPMGAAVGAMTGLIGATNAQREEAERLREQMEKNQEALEMNNHRLREMQRQITGGPDIDILDMQALIEQVRTGGPLTEEEGKEYTALIKRLASRYGIDYFDSEGRAIEGAAEQLIEAVELAIISMTQFGVNLTDVNKQIEAYNKLFDIENTPEQALQDTYSVLSQMAPQLMEQLGLENIDLGTEAGREMLLEGMREIYNMIVSGELTPELLGAFTDKNQLIDAILRTKDALDEFHEQLYNVTTDFPRAMDIIYYEQLHGTYGLNEKRNLDVTPIDDGIITETAPAWNVHGGITIVVKDVDTGYDILNRVERAAERRAGRGGSVELETGREEAW